MSSLAATQADGYYFPPDWRPEYGGLSKFQGSKGANQYQQHGIIRFELPFDGWCLKCKRHISKGSRFNAKKDKEGMYFTTQIWRFSMKCESCDNQLVIKTDPQNRTYDFAEGIRKMEQEFEPEANDSIIQAVSDETRAKLLSDPIYRLQHEKQGIMKVLSAQERLTALHDLKEEYYKNDADSNSHLRKLHRSKRAEDKGLLEEGKKFHMSIPLVKAAATDTEAAKSVNFTASRKRKFDISERKRKVAIQSESIFGGGSAGDKRAGAMQKQAVSRIDVAKIKLRAVDSNKTKKMCDTNIILRHKSSPGGSGQTLASSLSLLTSYGSDDDQLRK